jgi:hypothetical protein
LALQRSAGNAAVAGLVRSQAGRGPIVQRHGSAEHALMGDANPKDIKNAVPAGTNRAHLLNEEYRRALFFKDDPHRDPRRQFPDIRWVQMMGTAKDALPVWVSNGELNALADYLPDGDTIDHLPHATLLPVLQRMRGIIANDAENAIGDARLQDNKRGTVVVPAGEVPVMIDTFEGDDASVGGQWKQSPHNHPIIGAVSGAAAEVSDLDDATASLGPQRYQGLLSRNACHFAPFSWERWQHFHQEALAAAREHHRLSPGSTVERSIDVFTEANARKAIVTNGYGDHFLQDSFAAGHLVNKTLVMQWFTDWINRHEKASPTFVDNGMGGVEISGGSRSLPSGVSEQMLDVIPRQAGIGARGLYQQGGKITDSSSADRAGGTGPASPQTVEERTDKSRRVAGTGVTATAGHTVDQNYQTYLDFLNTTFINLAAGAAHDRFNESGLTVVNGQGRQFVVGGDGTYLSRSDQAGAEAVAEAARQSRQSVEETLNSGSTAFGQEAIFSYVPIKVAAVAAVALPAPIGLEQWNDGYLRTLCESVIFPSVYSSTKNRIAATAHSKLVGGGASRDARH